MKLDLAARREELLRERAKIEEQIAALEKEHEQALARWQGDLRVVEAVLDQIEDIIAALGPDFSGRAPIAGTVEPNRRREKRDLLALTLDYVQKYPGNTADWYALTIEQNTKIRTLPQQILNKLEHLKANGDVRCDAATWDGIWWPPESLSGGAQDTAAEVEPMDENHG